MSYIIKEEDFNQIASYWASQEHGLLFPSIFVTPAYLESWWQVFSEKEAQLYLTSIWQDSKLIGIAPLQISNGIASLIGSPDVCDYLDFVTLAGREEDFFNALLANLKGKGIKEIDLSPVRADSKIMSSLTQMARQRGYRVSQEKVDVSLEMSLPQSWEDYFKLLDGKPRHELERKLRRLKSAGKVEYQIAQDSYVITPVLDEFLNLFSNSKREKSAFMTKKMAQFFHSLTRSLAQVNLVKFGSLKLSNMTMAMVMCFDYNDIIYLYNSAYEPSYSSLSPGIAAKAFYIRDSIEKDKRVFNFLKGSEPYKYQLGGKEVPIYRCQIHL